jgi:hypothetical protein
MLDGETYITASFNDDTPEGHMGRRRLYHTNLPEYERQREIYRRLNMSNEEILRLRYESIESELINETNYIPFFTGGPRATRVNPKWWMKVKMFFQNLLLYSDQVVGIAVIATIITFIVILVISKLLNAW